MNNSGALVALALGSFSVNARKIVGDYGIVTSSWDLVAMQSQINVLAVFLHPAADGRAWVDEDGNTVVTAEQLAEAKLAGATVFVGACYGLENDPMLEALKQAGVGAIIAGPGVNIGGSAGWLAGADLMAGALRSALQMGLPISAAWTVARAIVHVAQARGRAGAEDALAYRLLLLSEGGKPTGRTRVAAVVAGVIGLLVMLLNALSGGPQPLTFFSSILPPPAQVAMWEKAAYRDAVEVDIGAAIYLTDTDALTVTDWITPSEVITFTLVEVWNTAALSLTQWTVSAGSVMTDSGVVAVLP